MAYAVILQARMASTRNPYKVASLTLGKPLLFHQIKRIQLFTKKNIPVIVATTQNPLDDVVEFIATQAGAKIFRGDENDVMKRYIKAAEHFKADKIFRVCGDDPLIDPLCLKALYNESRLNQHDFISASHKQGWMLGTSAEYFTLKALKKAYKKSSAFEREHVVIHFNKNPDLYKVKRIGPGIPKVNMSLTVDYPNELESVKNVFCYFKNNIFSQLQLLDAIKQKKIKLKHTIQDFAI